MFKNLLTGQILEVSLGSKVSIRNIDPYFFYNFLETTKKFKHLIEHFDDPFKDTLTLFEELERQKLLIHISGVQYRKL